MNLDEIKNTITQLENAETTFSNCEKLASLYVVREQLRKTDLVPDSLIDESIQALLGDFILYHKNPCDETIKPLMMRIRHIVSELYNSCENVQDKQIVTDEISKINLIK